MKAVILAGGLGTRISEETHLKPKPMVEIGGKPILWHIMKIYCAHGVTDFIICLGYKGYLIKEYFANYYLHTSDVTFDMRDNSMKVHQNASEPWTVTLIDTGEFTQTGGRLKRIAPYLDNEDFCFTYGDGVSDVNVTELVKLHRSQNTLATITAVQPAGRFGALDMRGNKVCHFEEKPRPLRQCCQSARYRDRECSQPQNYAADNHRWRPLQSQNCLHPKTCALPSWRNNPSHASSSRMRWMRNRRNPS